MPKASQAATQKFVGRARQNARVENWSQSQADALALGGTGNGGTGNSELSALRQEVKVGTVVHVHGYVCVCLHNCREVLLGDDAIDIANVSPTS